MAGSYAKWLGGAWIESKERSSLKAQMAFGLLESFSDHARTAAPATTSSCLQSNAAVDLNDDDIPF